MRVILASASPRRRELLALLWPDFEVQPSGVDEAPFLGQPPRQMVQSLSRAKAQAISAAQEGPALVIGADTVVELDGRPLGKPRDRQEAAWMLGQLSGRTHLVHTGVCLCSGQGPESFAQTTQVRFARLTAEEIGWYIATGEPFDKAGAYGIQGQASRFIEGIEGDYFNVMGLPVQALYQRLKKFLPF